MLLDILRYCNKPKEIALVLSSKGLLMLNKAKLQQIEAGTYTGPFADVIFNKPIDKKRRQEDESSD